MNKKKIEIVFLVLTIFFGALSVFFYNTSKKIVTVDEVTYSENGSVNYKVFLNDKKYYNKEYLEEGMQYISSIIDYIDLNYTYKIDFDKEDDFVLNKKVVANVKIVDSDNNEKIIYEKSEVIKEDNDKTKKINFADNVKIDYGKYNKLTNEFKTNYGISANCKLYVDYIISYSNTSGTIKKAPVDIKITIPLSEQMINISKDPSINNNSSIIIKSTGNIGMFILAVLFIILTFISLINFVKKFKNRVNNESKYDRFIKKILRDNDPYITIAKEYSLDKSKNVIKIDSFKELLDVRNNIEKPIVYVKLDDNNSVFSIIENDVYEYRISREEMDK